MASIPSGHAVLAAFSKMAFKIPIHRGTDYVKIHGQSIPIRAEVASIDTLSAHADADEILNWLRSFSEPPKMTFITHGEPLASERLRKKIEEELRWPCTIPDYLETVTL